MSPGSFSKGPNWYSGTMKQSKAIPAYISDCAKPAQPLLKQLYKAIQKAAPDAEEILSYGMPCFRQHKNLVYFAAFKDHVSFFPTGGGMAAFKEELKKYKTSKGTVQFQFGDKLPLALITKIVKFRVRETTPKKAA